MAFCEGVYSKTGLSEALVSACSHPRVAVAFLLRLKINFRFSVQMNSKGNWEEGLTCRG